MKNCGNCKHYNQDESYCMASGEDEIYPGDSCENWESGLTKEEEDEIIGDREAHRRMVED